MLHDSERRLAFNQSLFWRLTVQLPNRRFELLLHIWINSKLAVFLLPFRYSFVSLLFKDFDYCCCCCCCCRFFLAERTLKPIGFRSSPVDMERDNWEIILSKRQYGEERNELKEKNSAIAPCVLCCCLTTVVLPFNCAVESLATWFSHVKTSLNGSFVMATGPKFEASIGFGATKVSDNRPVLFFNVVALRNCKKAIAIGRISCYRMTINCQLVCSWSSTIGWVDELHLLENCDDMSRWIIIKVALLRTCVKTAHLIFLFVLFVLFFFLLGLLR